METGTTTVAITLKDAVIMATERRVTMEHFIAHKDEDQVRKIVEDTIPEEAGLKDIYFESDTGEVVIDNFCNFVIRNKSLEYGFCILNIVSEYHF